MCSSVFVISFSPVRDYAWQPGPWRACTEKCMQKREIRCFDNINHVKMSNSKCKQILGHTPREFRECEEAPCRPSIWLPGDWNPCSVTCGQVRADPCYKFTDLSCVGRK